MLLELATPTRQLVSEFLAEHDLRPQTLTLGSNGAIKEAVRLGLGVSLQSRVAAYHLEDRVGRIEIPTEPTTELRNGKKYTIDRVFLPGYVFVEMALDNDLWHVVKNTPRVTGFLQTGDQPNALSEAEVNAMLNRSDVTKEKPKLKLKFAKGEQVRITEGPFANFNGAVDDVNEDKQTLKVMVSIFGRPTPTEVSFANVEKAEE